MLYYSLVVVNASARTFETLVCKRSASKPRNRGTKAPQTTPPPQAERETVRIGSARELNYAQIFSTNLEKGLENG